VKTVSEFYLGTSLTFCVEIFALLLFAV
jgi:hypothetical protein